MNSNQKIQYIDGTFSFFLDVPFEETARDFPSPDDVVEDWYLSAMVFRMVRDRQKIQASEYPALHTLVTEVEASYKASAMLGEKPDLGEDLAEGYDDDEFPEGFVDRHQMAVWEAVQEVQSKDERPQEWSIKAE